MTRPTLSPALDALLRSWLPRQRWFPVKSAHFSFEPVGSVTLEAPVPAATSPGAPTGDGGARFEVLLLAVTYPTADGDRTDVVQVPLSFRSLPLAGAGAALLGEIQADGGTPGGWVYDGVHDAAFIAAWLELMRSRGATAEGSATGELVASDHGLPHATGKVRVLSGEQSNSSVIVDDGTRSGCSPANSPTAR